MHRQMLRCNSPFFITVYDEDDSYADDADDTFDVDDTYDVDDT